MCVSLKVEKASVGVLHLADAPFPPSITLVSRAPGQIYNSTAWTPTHISVTY